LLSYPVLRRGPHVCLPQGIGGCELVDIHELECSLCRCPCLGDRETAIYFPTNVWFHLSVGRAAYLRDFREEDRVQCFQNREYIGKVSAIFSWTLGCDYVNPVVEEHPLEFSFDRIFPSFWNPYILETDDGGSLFKYLVYFLLAAFVSVGSHVP